MEPNDQQVDLQQAAPEQKDPRQELAELEELERLSSKEAAPQYDPAKDPMIMGGTGAVAGAAGSGIYGLGTKLVPKILTGTARMANLQQAAPIFNFNTAEGLQAYMNSQLEHPGVNIPLHELEQRTGQVIRNQSEAQDAINSIRGRKAASTPDVRWVNGKFQNMGDIWTPATAPIDISDLKQKYSSMLASPAAAKQAATNVGKAVARGSVKYGMPVVAGAGIGYDVQDALNRWEAGETGRAAIQGAGALGGALSLIPTAPTRVAGTALSVGAPLLNTYLDTKLGHPSVFEKQGTNQPYKVFPQGRPAGMKEGGSTAEMKAALKMKNGGLYENIHAKQERIAHGSGEHMHKPGSAGAPSEQDFIESAKTAKMKEGGLSLSVGRGEKLPVSQGAGLTEKGREKYNRETGSHLQAPQPEGGPRKDSFCARMQGVVDHAKGDAERAKASLKRWKC